MNWYNSSVVYIKTTYTYTSSYTYTTSYYLYYLYYFILLLNYLYFFSYNSSVVYIKTASEIISIARTSLNKSCLSSFCTVKNFALGFATKTGTAATFSITLVSNFVKRKAFPKCFCHNDNNNSGNGRCENPECRNITEYGGIWRNMAEYHGIWRNITEYGGISRNITTFSRNIPEHHNIFRW